MAEFCAQCSIDIFHEDNGDFKGMCTPEEKVAVICEGCGGTWVDCDGRCVYTGCLKQHGLTNDADSTKQAGKLR